jgi:hypothetical protein
MSDYAELSVKIEVGMDPIRGTTDRGTGPCPFWGWLELTQRLEALRTAEEPASSAGAAPPPAA